MKITLFPLLLLLAAAEVHAQTPRRDANAYRREGYRLVWSDEFTTDGRPDPRRWGYEEGFERNHEAQYYQRDNALCRDGILTIEARRERDAPAPNTTPTAGTGTRRRHTPNIPPRR